MKAIYKDEVLKPLTKPDLREGEEVEISIVPMSLSKDFRGALKLPDPNLMEEIAESDELI
jgi:predicted DNA-binding antitoxin AbrB/MazE fold protein